jgi:hypothetical protein
VQFIWRHSKLRIMGWVKVKKINFQSDEPLVTILANRFSFNSIFFKIAELTKYKYVTYYLDHENRKIAFEFQIHETPDSYKVIGGTAKGTYCQSTELFKIPWVKKVSQFKNSNRFKPIRDGKKYIITLMPVFEFSFLRKDYLKIRTDTTGIYRYLDNGKIVYIGKGNIRKRLQELGRDEWKFDLIEYSIISNEDLQFEWESYWLNDFKDSNQNHLPTYNLISGKSS